MINLSHSHLRRTMILTAIVAALAIPAGSAQAQLKKTIDNLASKFSASQPEFKLSDAKPELKPGAEPSADLPTDNKEIGERLTPRAILKDSPALQKILGDSAVFVYDPQNKPDPMLIPWTRARVMFGELSAIAEQAIAQKNWQMAEIAYRQMLNDLNDPAYRAKGEAGLEKLGQIVAQDEAVRLQGTGKAVEAKLPPWIAENTKSVIIDKVQPLCLVGSFILKVGDVVPRQPVNVTVTKIEPTAVHYQVQSKTFVVKVQEGE